MLSATVHVERNAFSEQAYVRGAVADRPGGGRSCLEPRWLRLRQTLTRRGRVCTLRSYARRAASAALRHIRVRLKE